MLTALLATALATTPALDSFDAPATVRSARLLDAAKTLSVVSLSEGAPSRLVEIDRRLEVLRTAKNPWTVPMALAIVVTNAPLLYSVGYAFVLCAEAVAAASWAVVFTPFLFPIVVVYGAFMAPIALWAVAGVGLALSIASAVAASSWTRALEAEATALHVERRAIVSSPALTPATPSLVTF